LFDEILGVFDITDFYRTESVDKDMWIVAGMIVVTVEVMEISAAALSCFNFFECLLKICLGWYKLKFVSPSNSSVSMCVYDLEGAWRNSKDGKQLPAESSDGASDLLSILLEVYLFPFLPHKTESGVRLPFLLQFRLFL
jgi:hypothetical protein